VAEVTEEPAAWWEASEDAAPVVGAPVEAVAFSERVDDVADAVAPWWEASEDAEPVAEAPVEAVAFVEPVAEVTEEPAPWWETSDDAEPVAGAPVEAVAFVEPVAEVSEEPTAWWEASDDAEPVAEAPVEAVAFVEPVAEVTDAPAPWWETSDDAEPVAVAPVEAAASVEPVAEVTEEPTAWWEASDDDAEPVAEAPVEAVAFVEPVAEVTEEPTAWWEASDDAEPVAEAPVEAVAFVEPVAEVTEEPTPWWEASDDDAEPVAVAPIEAVAFVEPVAEVTEEPTAWWEASDDAEPVVEAPVEAVASVEPVASDEDDPWADFVAGKGPSEDVAPPPPASAMPVYHAAIEDAPQPAAADDDMWGDIAARAEEAAQDESGIDLAASLESQMAQANEPAFGWRQGDDDPGAWESRPAAASKPAYIKPEEQEDVILAAFERHASMPDPEAEPHNDEVFAELLGTEAAEIVAEASDADGGERSFLKLAGWAPQRNNQPLDGGWAEEQEVQEHLHGIRNVYAPAAGASDGTGFAPPPWAMEGLEGEDEAGPAPRSGTRTKTWIRELVETGLLALLVFLSVRASFQNFKVEGSSMYPTLEDGQFLIVNKLVYSEVDMEKLGEYVPFVEAGSDPKRNVFHGPERGDIVVLVDPRDPATDLIKRVIGLPGETVEIVDGKVYINDRLLEEPYITSPWNDSMAKIVLPPDEFFVMGDNRENSLDSRSAQVGLIGADLIIGKAMLSYWPQSKFGLAPNEAGSLGDEKPVLTTQRVDD